MQKDTQNVLLTVGVITLALGSGAYAYHEQDEEIVVTTEEMPVSDPQTIPEIEEEVVTANDPDNGTDDVVAPVTTTEPKTTTVTPVTTTVPKTTTVTPVTTTQPATTPVSTTQVTPTQTTAVATTPTTTTAKTTTTKTTTTKPSRQSSAS